MGSTFTGVLHFRQRQFLLFQLPFVLPCLLLSPARYWPSLISHLKLIPSYFVSPFRSYLAIPGEGEFIIVTEINGPFGAACRDRVSAFLEIRSPSRSAECK